MWRKERAMTATTAAAASRPTTCTAWTLEDVRSLGLTMDVATAAQILGVSRSTGYALAKIGRFPVNVVRVGHRYVVPTAAMIRLLEAE
jgi:hypothetical protein